MRVKPFVYLGVVIEETVLHNAMLQERRAVAQLSSLAEACVLAGRLVLRDQRTELFTK